MNERFRGTIAYTKGSHSIKAPKQWKAIITDTKLRKKIKEEIIIAKDMDTAITAAKILAGKWEEKYG